jgi:hypothetical protein
VVAFGGSTHKCQRRQMKFRMPPSAVRMILPTEPTAKLSHKPSQWRFMHGETDHLTNREVFDKKFWIAHGVFLDSIIYDAELTHRGLAHHRCIEGA